MQNKTPLLEIPIYAKTLIEQLDTTFPDKCPDLSSTDRSIWFAAGQRSVVNFLLDLIEREGRGNLE